MSLAINKLSYEEIEDHAYRSLGRFFVTFSRIEFKIALTLQNVIGYNNLDVRSGAIGKLSFREKLEYFLEMTIAKYGDCDEFFCKVFAWYMAADTMRETRNRFAHGRWGVQEYRQRIAHVAGYPDGPQDERSYSLTEFDAIFMDAEILDRELNDIMKINFL